MTRLRSYLLLCLFVVLPFSANAMLPVVDVGAIGNLIKQFHQLQAQYELLNKTYSNAKDRLKAANNLIDENRGKYGWGNFKNGSQELTEREWSPDTWDHALQGLAGGNPDRYQELVKQYKQNHPETLNDSDYQKGASKTNKQVYQQQTKVNKAATVNASYAFNDIKNHLENLHKLSEKIEETKNTKSALDLLARIVTEQSYISVQELKMQTIMNQQLAAQNSAEIAGATTTAKFNTLPDDK